ncbi:hypothetical protein [Rubritalea tangerina]|uniref:Uncharacterized protein n=1 Tax=Rubritalea tangerina TaxID=430798 RepID=A0ABW4Z7C3_9BACT
MLAGVVVADDMAKLNTMLEARVEANKKYRDQFMEDAKESDYAKKLVPLEKALGEEWVHFLNLVKKSDDKSLKVATLKLEVMDEMCGCYYDLEWSESLMEKVKLRNQLAEWKKKLEQLKEIEGASAAKPESETK